MTDKVHGRQFKAENITCVAPKSIVGIERYLASGLIKGIGKVLARRIVETFGENTLNVLNHQSARLAEVPKLGRAKIEQIRAFDVGSVFVPGSFCMGQLQRVLGSVLIRNGFCASLRMTKIGKHCGPDMVCGAFRSFLRLGLVWGRRLTQTLTQTLRPR